jgi:hypothetical protein
MADQSDGPEPKDRDPWASPSGGTPPPGAGPAPRAVPPGSPTPSASSGDRGFPAPYAPPAPPVHELPTVASLPAAGGPGAAVPPQVAFGGPAGPLPGFGPGPPPAAPDPYGAYTPPFGHGPAPMVWHPPVGQHNNMGIAALVLGILSVVLFCAWGIVGVVLGVLALVFGAIGRKRVRNGLADNPGQALAGIILGAAGTALGALYLVLIIGILVDQHGP